MKIGLALSGDGIKGAAAEGVLCALKDMSVNVDLISATGSAALPAVLYACNMPREASFTVIQKVLGRQGAGAFRYKVNRMLGKDRVFNSDCIEKRLKKELKNLNITSSEDIKKPISITAIDLLSGCPVAFSKEISEISSAVVVKNSFDLNEVIRAAMSHRGVLLPRVIGNMCLTDSGYRNLFSWPLRISGANKILLVDLSGCSAPFGPGKVDLLSREADLYAQKLMADNSIGQMPLPVCEGFRGEVCTVRDLFELGYAKTMELRDRIYNFLFFE